LRTYLSRSKQVKRLASKDEPEGKVSHPSLVYTLYDFSNLKIEIITAAKAP
jgi:hypothetical protein